jgi:hypothetical protein
LKKSHLMAVDAESKIVYQNSYRNGRITQKGLGNMLSQMKKFPGMGDTASAAEREFVSGDKMWVTGIEMREKEVLFTLFSDAYPGTRFGADLSFPLERGSNPTAREVMADVAEVFDVQPPNSEGSQQTQQQPLQQLSQPANLQAAAMQRSEAPPPPIAPPPPPPADPKEIKLGQTPQQVVGSFGQPDRVIKLTSKQIYLYKDMKVTFVGGKVTAVE